METIGVVQSMACFVTENAHALDVCSAFYFEHLSALEPDKPRMCEVEGNCNARHAVRRKPFLSEPHVGPEGDSPLVKLAIESIDSLLERCALDSDREITQTEIEQLVVR
jgi:hypothetical protein